MSAPPEKVGKIVEQLQSLITEALQASAVAAGRAAAEESGRPGHDRFSAIYVVAAATCAAQHVLASLLGHTGDADNLKVTPEDVYKLINPTSTLLAALLAQSMCPQSTFEGCDEHGTSCGMALEFGNPIIFDAIQQVERMTGRPVDGYVRPDMLEAVRKSAAGSDEPMNRFLAQRRETPGSLH